MTDTLAPTRIPWWQLTPDQQRDHQNRVEATRKLRVWKRAIAPAAAKIDRALADETTTHQLITDFAFKKNAGKAKALARLRQHLAPAKLSAGRDIFTWSWLKPTGPLLASDDPSLRQNCVIARFGIGGRRSAHFAGAAVVLSLEVPDHALVRLLERSPNADIEAAVFEAQDGYLHANNQAVLECMKSYREFYLRAGPGLFICTG
jgi:hypothetical protein